MLYSRSLFLFYFLYNNVYMLIANFLFISPSTIPFYKFAFYVNKFIHILFLDSTYKWYHLFFFLWLTSLNMIISMSIHVVANGLISFFVANIPLCIYATFSFICQWTWNLGFMYLFKLEFSLNICPGVDLQDYMVTLFLVF